MNTRLAVASHILAFLDMCAGVPATSEMIAASVNTNPTFVRRLLAQLNKAGLTRTQMGTGGGALLAAAPSAITLLDVYRAVDNSEFFSSHEGPSAQCPVGRNIRSSFESLVEPAQKALLDRLEQTTIADLGRDIARREAMLA